MAKIWSTEIDYPEIKVAMYDEKKSGIDNFELKIAKFLENPSVLYFNLSKRGLARINDYGIINSHILIPLANEVVRNAIERIVNKGDIQFIPVIINCEGNCIDKSYFLINFLKKVDAVDKERSKPIMVKIPGFPDAKLGFEKMILLSDFPCNGIGRQYDSLPDIIVGDELADAILRSTKRGVRFITEIPPR